MTDLLAAGAAVEAEDHPVRGARACRAVRAALSELIGDVPDLVSKAPGWATISLPEDLLAAFWQAVAAPSWQETAVLLRSPAGSVLLAPRARPVRTALARLYQDHPGAVTVLEALDAIDQNGLDAVVDELCAGERHATLLQEWVATPTWTASRRYLTDHPELWSDPRTLTVLQERSDPAEQQHAGIAQLTVVCCDS